MRGPRPPKPGRSTPPCEEQITSVKEEEIAGRAKRIELIASSARTEREVQRLVSIAKAEKEAAEMRALADIAEANASEVRYAKDAKGQRLLNESENMRSDASRRSAIFENLVQNLPNIIRETVKPMENIESIKILQVDGLPGLNSPSETAGAGGAGRGRQHDRPRGELGDEVPHAGRVRGRADEGPRAAGGESRERRRHVVPQLPAARPGGHEGGED